MADDSFVNALQGTDLAVDGLNLALATFIRKRPDDALGEELNDANSAWSVATEWERYATALKRQNEEMAQRLVQLKTTIEKQAENSSNTLKTFTRYQQALIARINDLDERYQHTSAQLYALRRQNIRAGLLAMKPGDSHACSSDPATDFHSDVAEFMQSKDVRLGVPSIEEAFR
jgi:DNA anti-recombination protein RmuC